MLSLAQVICKYWHTYFFLVSQWPLFYFCSMLLDCRLWAISAVSQNRLHRTAPTDDDTIRDTRCDDASICNQYIWPLKWKHGKTSPGRKFFCLSGFWAFGAFSENLLNPWQRASVKASTVTRPQTMLVALLLQPQLHCGTARHSLSPGLREGCEWGRRSPLQPLHWAASPASPTPHCTLSSAFPAHLLVPSSHPRTAHCQQMLLGGLPKYQTPLWTAAVKPGSATPLAGTCCQQCSFYYQNR